MTPLGNRTAPVLSTELETMALPDGAALRTWVRRRTRRHLHGVWALVGDVYSVLLTLIVGGVWWWMHHSWRGVLCLVLGLVRMCVVMRWRVWWLVSRPRRWLGMWGTGVGR